MLNRVTSHFTLPTHSRRLLEASVSLFLLALVACEDGFEPGTVVPLKWSENQMFSAKANLKGDAFIRDWIDATVPFGYESDFMRPVYPIDKVNPKDFFTDDDLANVSSRMKGWVRSLARTGRRIDVVSDHAGQSAYRHHQSAARWPWPDVSAGRTHDRRRQGMDGFEYQIRRRHGDRRDRALWL